MNTACRRYKKCSAERKSPAAKVPCNYPLHLNMVLIGPSLGTDLWMSPSYGYSAWVAFMNEPSMRLGRSRWQHWLDRVYWFKGVECKRYPRRLIRSTGNAPLRRWMWNRKRLACFKTQVWFCLWGGLQLGLKLKAVYELWCKKTTYLDLL